MKFIFVCLMFVTFAVSCFSKMVVPINLELFNGKIIKGDLYDFDDNGYYGMCQERCPSI